VAPLKLVSDQNGNNVLSQPKYPSAIARGTVKPAAAQPKTCAELNPPQSALFTLPRFLARSTSVLTRPHLLLATRRFA